MFRQPVPFRSGNILRAWGSGFVIVGGVFVEMSDEFVFTMDTPVDRNYFFERII